ncbi:MAG TPA: zf-HC2 domain-containing protein [Ktedonobacterales bacterium]|jgi:anti-sigma factor RsiW|nr:zf-HC2 domain-containing protein [Ktedonobacterales bacterium]
MNCTRAGGWMSVYVDGRLDVRRMARLERHLMTCAECRRDLARLRVMQMALSEERLVDEPVGLTAHVMRRISAYEAQRASDAARARQRAALKADRRAARAQAWRAVGSRRVLALSVALLALVVWAQVTTPTLLPGVAAHLVPGMLQLLVTPGPYEVAWSVWIAGAGLALAIFTWFARTDASEELRRTLAERLPQLW